MLTRDVGHCSEELSVSVMDAYTAHADHPFAHKVGQDDFELLRVIGQGGYGKVRSQL